MNKFKVALGVVALGGLLAALIYFCGSRYFNELARVFSTIP